MLATALAAAIPHPQLFKGRRLCSSADQMAQAPKNNGVRGTLSSVRPHALRHSELAEGHAEKAKGRYLRSQCLASVMRSIEVDLNKFETRLRFCFYPSGKHI